MSAALRTFLFLLQVAVGGSAGAGDAYVRVARAQAARAPRVTAAGCVRPRATRCAPSHPPQAPGWDGPAPSLARGAREPAATGASFWRRRLVPPPWWPALASVLLGAGGIFQIEKLTHQALKCFAPASRGLELHSVRMGCPSCPHNTGCVKSIQGVSETFPCSRCLCHVSGKLLRAPGFHFGSGVGEILKLPRCSEV